MRNASAADAALVEVNDGCGRTLIRPGDVGYDQARTVFNAMVDRRPALIARCVGVSDVIAALRIARQQKLTVAVRGGGHGVSGHAVCDDGIVVDLSGMKGMRIDPAGRRAWVQGGLTWGELDRETHAFDLAVTGGRVPATGVAGLTLGGGSGWIERKFGLTVDSLVSADVVTANGRFQRASPTDDPELLWGLKGGGGNFGVVTAFEFRLHEVGSTMLAGMLLFPIERAAEVIRSYRDFMAVAPDEVGGAATIACPSLDGPGPAAGRPQPICALVACYVGPIDAAEAVLRPLRELEPTYDSLRPITYLALQRLIEPGNQPGRRQYWKSGFLQELSDEAIELFVAHASRFASPLTENLLIPMRGAVARVGEDETPLGFREAGWNYHLLSQWANPAEDERQIGWTQRFSEALRPQVGEGAYLNFVMDEGPQQVARSFGAARYARLVALKDRYDPHNVFCLNQNIEPSPAGDRLLATDREPPTGG